MSKTAIIAIEAPLQQNIRADDVKKRKIPPFLKPPFFWEKNILKIEILDLGTQTIEWKHWTSITSVCSIPTRSLCL